ncbi:leucyl aminopeptidase [Helcobacillus massiliensis]|uniref:leucyl aminopeptidase n=1 Tax=Helcobacillus massiliensis TaxID=521392 RepID=UPI0021A5E45E|nr:leucyl aminopeptidase [Helcobacillus massiliensis]MCT1557109.1 leucyl aminopeptidase [Helcobacillus massiliensis]MCT2036156.1 leucyl aminopeptidase [Helcobacillus massiliensis]MCT2331287.1 leucyl aminopeptidase [Helcobacillus massiliensis]
MTDMKITATKVESVTAEVLVLPLLAGEKDADATPVGLPKLSSAVSAVRASGAKGATTRLPAVNGLKAQSVLLVGLGSSDLADVTDEHIREAFGSAARALTGVKSAAIAFPGGSDDQVVAAAEGFALGSYNYIEHKTAESAKKSTPVESFEVVTVSKPSTELSARLDRAMIVAEHVHAVRDLVNTPPNLLFPEAFADIAAKAAKKVGVGVEILDEKKLLAGGYGGIMGVGQGSTRKPRLVKLTYVPKKATRHVSIVGKGITFDTGGISLKPGASMDEMTSDMAGAATTLHTVLTAAKLELPIAVTGFLALAENMPGGGAQRPGDVVTMRNGMTVEVLNTDAEGRMVMADALVDAAAEKPDLLIDVATLTGAAVVALGSRTAAVMGTEDARDELWAASKRAGEAFWPLPFPEELRETLNGRVADLSNIGERPGGTLSAGVFLQEFTDGLPWAHLDIAPTGFTQKPYGYTTRGGTGQSLRTMLAVLEDTSR